MTTIRNLAGLLLGVVLLTGCGGSAEPAKKTPTPPKAYTAAQLEAALPSVDDIEDGEKQTAECPKGDNCFTPKDGENWARQFSLATPLEGAEAERAANEGIPDFVYVDVFRNTSPTAATTASDQARRQRSEFDGPFDNAAKKGKKDGEFSYGERGKGTLADTKVSGWSGYVSGRDFALTDLEGDEDVRIREVLLRVTRGNASVSILVGSGQGKRSLDECEKIARGVAKDYLARLG